VLARCRWQIELLFMLFKLWTSEGLSRTCSVEGTNGYGSSLGACGQASCGISIVANGASNIRDAQGPDRLLTEGAVQIVQRDRRHARAVQNLQHNHESGRDGANASVTKL
jgi:hypothetical protein